MIRNIFPGSMLAMYLQMFIYFSFVVSVLVSHWTIHDNPITFFPLSEPWSFGMKWPERGNEHVWRRNRLTTGETLRNKNAKKARPKRGDSRIFG